MKQLVGARPADRLRAQLRPPGRRLPQGHRNGKARCAPTFRDGLATDYVVDAVLASAKSGRWVKVKQA
jgi:predicted dehydrogenase